MPSMLTPRQISERRRAFRQLHESGCFVIPNPWDSGSARYLEHLGFKALATTSSGAAWSRGEADGQMQLEAVLEHLREMVQATPLPINADFEAGFAADAAGVARNVRKALDTGVAGLSIEDSTGNPDQPLRDITEAVERIRSARAAIDEAGGEALLVGRAENFFAGKPDLDDAIRRLKAYSEAGADCLYAPGLRTAEDVAAAVKAVAPLPLNVLMWTKGLSVAELADLGVRRISVGGALARAAWAGFLGAAREIAAEGRFDRLGEAATGAELKALLKP